MILVTGAAGKTGLAVIKGLKENGAAVRGLIHQEAYSDAVLAAGADEILHGRSVKSGGDRASMDGVQSSLPYPPQCTSPGSGNW